MSCPETHKNITCQLCGLLYYPKIGGGCINEARCNRLFQNWLRNEREVQQLHNEYLQTLKELEG